MQSLFSFTKKRGGVSGTLYLPLDVSGTNQYTSMMGDYPAMSKMPLAGGAFLHVVLQIVFHKRVGAEFIYNLTSITFRSGDITPETQ